MPEELKTVAEGIPFDLKFIALHPLGNFSFQVIKKWAQSKQLILFFSTYTVP